MLLFSCKISFDVYFNLFDNYPLRYRYDYNCHFKSYIYVSEYYFDLVIYPNCYSY